MTEQILSVIDTATDMVIATVPVNVYPIIVTPTNDSQNAYVANFGSGNVSIIDTTLNTVSSVVTTDVDPRPMAAA